MKIVSCKKIKRNDNNDSALSVELDDGTIEIFVDYDEAMTIIDGERKFIKTLKKKQDKKSKLKSFVEVELEDYKDVDLDEMEHK